VEKVEVSKSVIDGVEDFITHRFHLKECYPNPAQGETKIGFYLNSPAQVSLRLYDQKGKLVKQIMQEQKTIGEHEVTLDVSQLKPGTYIYRIDAGLLKDSKKLIVKN